MGNKRSHFNSIFLLLAMVSTFILSNCDANKDLYNPDRVQEEAQKDFPVKNIDPEHTWETSTVCNASVSVDEKAGETYTIKVYTANPYNTEGNAALLAKTSVGNGKTVNFSYDMPATLQYAYVMKIDGQGYSSVKATSITNNRIDVTFGGINTVTASTRAKATSSIIQFEEGDIPDVDDITVFPTEESVAGYPDYRKDSDWTKEQGHYIVTSQYNSINYQGDGGGVYIKGDVTLTKLELGTNCKLYVLPGSSLTLNIDYSMSKSGNAISIGKNALLKMQGKNLSMGKSNIYNLGTIEAKSIKITEAGTIYNAGTITVEGHLEPTSTKALLINEGTLTANSFATQGSSSFYNSGTTTITNHSALSSSNQRWENQGYYRTGSMKIQASYGKALNACQLYVDGELNIDPGANADEVFMMDGGAYTECGSLYMHISTIKMGGKSFLNVLGTATYGNNPKGFYSTTQEYALIKIGKAVQRTTGEGNSIGYRGKIYVACNDHFENGMNGSVPYINWEGDAQLTGADNADIDIPSSQCNPGYTSTPGGGGGDTPLSYTYAFEDMSKGLGDYDFNDAVLYVTVPYEQGGTKYIDVTLKAAGASKSLGVFFNNKGSVKTVFADVHSALGVPAGTLTNTGIATGTEQTVTIEVGSDFSLTTDGDFYIFDGKREVHIPNFTPGFQKGNVPYAIRVAEANWKWPKETVNIVSAYPEFSEWAQDSTTETEWYKTPVPGKTM